MATVESRVRKAQLVVTVSISIFPTCTPIASTYQHIGTIASVFLSEVCKFTVQQHNLELQGSTNIVQITKLCV